MFIFLSVCSLLVPLSMIILGYMWKGKPPKDRQGSSGYRTTMSRMNDETWRYAHRCWGWINFVLGIILVILSIFILILTKDDTNFEMISVYLVFYN
ncbi:MAG: SdpI family protein [Ruminococcus sp.]